MKNKLTTPDEFAALINDGDEIMYGGFLRSGHYPDSIVDAIIRKGVKDLTVIRQRHLSSQPRHSQAD